MNCARSPVLGLLVLAALAAPASQGSAQELIPPTPFSLTISGGVSLGAYEAGLLYYLLEWLRANESRSDLRLATGSSAGSVNAVFSIMDRCADRSPSPTQSSFYRTWVPLGFDQLFTGKATTQAAFSHAWLDRLGSALAAEWSAGLPVSCDVVLGVAATRVIPRRVEVGSADLKVGRMEERFALRIQGRGPHLAPRLTNYVDPQGRGDLLLLPEDSSGEVSTESLRDLLFASSAVPLAFSPVPLRHCVTRPDRPARCPASEAVEALFVDGSFFDTTPLRLAATLARAGLQELPDGRAQWVATPDFGAPRPTRDLRFAFISPDLTAYPAANETSQIDAHTTVTALAAQEAESFLETARSKNLYTLLEEVPEIGKQVVVPVRHFPAASSPLAAFFGFFETEFRRYDFYLGMYDARRAILGQVVPRLPAGTDLETFSFPEDAAFGSADWRPFECLRAIFDEPGRAAVACHGADLSDFRILAQTSLDRLYDECRPMVGAAPIAPGETQCLRARAGEAPPAVPEVHLAEGSVQRRPREGDAAFTARLLSLHHFRFHDLGVDESDPEAALRRIRAKIALVVTALAEAQPVGEGLALQRAGELAANALLYVPPTHVIWLGLGRELEVGYSHALPGESAVARALRLHLALQLDGPYGLLSSQLTTWGVTALGGLELRPPALNSEAFQLGVVARAGWQFASGDAVGTRVCTAAADDLSGCSRLALQGGVYGVVLEILRLQLMAEWLPPWSSRRGLFAVSPSLGVQFVF